MSDTFAEWQAEATADEVTVRVCLNRRLYREFYEAAAALDALRDQSGQAKLDDTDDDQLSAMLEAVADLEQQVSDAEKPMVFRTVSPSQRRRLEEQHPATDAQKQSDPKAVINDDSYWPAVLAACCVEPGLTVEQAAWLRDGDESWPGLPEQKWAELVAAVNVANVDGSSIPKSVRSTVRRLRPELNSITQLPTGSPSASSEAGR